MISCEEFDSLIDAYVNDSLSAFDRTAVEAHMAECESCRLTYEFALKTQQALHSFPTIKAPNDFLDKVNERINKEAPSLYTPKFIFRKYQKRIYSAVAACLAFALILGTKPWSLVKHTDKDIDTPVSSFVPIKDSDNDNALVVDAPVAENAPADVDVPVTTAPISNTDTVVKKPTVAPTTVPVVSKPAITTAAPAVAVAPTEAADDSNKYTVSTTSIAVPSDKYVVSDESDNANYAKIEANSKLEQSYALVESLDGDVISPDVLAKISQYDNIVVTDPLLIKDDDAIVSLTVLADDMDSINKALDVFKFSNNGNKYKISKNELKQFLNTLDNLGVKYDLGDDSVKGDTIIELITA